MTLAWVLLAAGALSFGAAARLALRTPAKPGPWERGAAAWALRGAFFSLLGLSTVLASPWKLPLLLASVALLAVSIFKRLRSRPA